MVSIDLDHVYKIFGENPQQALDLLQKGKDKSEIQSETGLVVGVRDISFELPHNQLFVIMGLSGSGKSTLLRCVNRLVEPTRGVITLNKDGEELEITSASENQLREIRETQISMVFQNFGLFPHRTVIENVTYGLEIQGLSKEERKQKGQEVIELVGLGDWADSYPSQLSGGMQQRVGLARGLATGAEILLMDEPFSALDPLIKVHMQDELLSLQEEVERTILFVTHDLNEALKIGERIAIMEAGRIVQKGEPEEIIVNPKTEYVENFVENADPSGVLSAITVANKEPEQIERNRYRLDEHTTIELDEAGHLESAFRNGNEIPIKHFNELGSVSANEIMVSVGRETPMSKLMEIRMEATTTPIVVLSEEGIFKGFVTESNILHGLLEKGREE